MSIWVRVVLSNPLGDTLSATNLREGIAERLTLLTYLFCPEDEEDPKDVLNRLQIEPIRDDRSFLLKYRLDDLFIRLDIGGGDIEEERQELESNLEGLAGHGVRVVKEALSATREIAAFALKAHDLDSMGWPLTIAAAAYLADKGGGLIQADGRGWMRPTEKEIEFVLEDER